MLNCKLPPPISQTTRFLPSDCKALAAARNAKTASCSPVITCNETFVSWDTCARACRPFRAIRNPEVATPENSRAPRASHSLLSTIIFLMVFLISHSGMTPSLRFLANGTRIFLASSLTILGVGSADITSAALTFVSPEPMSKAHRLRTAGDDTARAIVASAMTKPQRISAKRTLVTPAFIFFPYRRSRSSYVETPLRRHNNLIGRRTTDV